MPFKKDEHGNYVEQDGLLVFVGPDGAERPYDPDAKAKQIAELTEKSAKRGKELEDFKARYAALADIEDPGAFVCRPAGCAGRAGCRGRFCQMLRQKPCRVGRQF